MIDYKRIIKSREVRTKILSFLSFIPDKLMLKIQYRMKTGRNLELSDPKRFTEKLQWYKLYYKNPLMIQCIDKFDVREYVKSKGLEDILIPCYGVYESECFDWDKLPDKFVIKDTLGGGGNSVILVKDKKKENIERLKEITRKWVSCKADKKSGGREWPYYSGKSHRIIIEKLLITDEEDDLPDYKFFCFDGKVFCSYKMENYALHHDKGRLGFFDRDFNLLSAKRLDFPSIEEQPQKPENYEKMIEYAEILSKDFPHVRVDFYNINGKIFFGELTFFTASGYISFEPDEFDFELGERFKLPIID